MLSIMLVSLFYQRLFVQVTTLLNKTHLLIRIAEKETLGLLILFTS